MIDLKMKGENMKLCNKLHSGILELIFRRCEVIFYFLSVCCYFLNANEKTC